MPSPSLPDRMRADLGEAMRSRDSVRADVLRTVLSAIANAEAVPMNAAVHSPTQGLVDHERRQPTDDDVARIVAEEVADRQHTIDVLNGAGRPDEAAELEAELAVLRSYLP
ncbi:MAG: GatB/YqeY domain-containing protein [Acidimicrobiia bacterium]|nr:GatB/YqeY domain-containing protein [Acidimicrobiia bacterium]